MNNLQIKTVPSKNLSQELNDLLKYVIRNRNHLIIEDKEKHLATVILIEIFDIYSQNKEAKKHLKNIQKKMKNTNPNEINTFNNRLLQKLELQKQMEDYYSNSKNIKFEKKMAEESFSISSEPILNER